MKDALIINRDQQAMLDGRRGLAKQMGMRLLLDMAATAGATKLVPVSSAHLSGVSPLTGGLGLRKFLAKLTSDPQAKVAVPTTLNSAGCDEDQFQEMRISAPNFLRHNQEIVSYYAKLGVRPTQSCIPYEWEGVITEGTAAWAESNAICFGNSYCDLHTNRESGLSALASALTGYTAYYGLLAQENRKPNIEVLVTADLNNPTDYSILGDWIGKQRQPSWDMPYGPIPSIKGLPASITHEEKKALSAAAANYGCPLLYVEDHPPTDYQARLIFGQVELDERYAALYPATDVSLITIGCPQASIGELRAAAELLRGKQVTSEPTPAGHKPPLWIFTSSANKGIAEKTGVAALIRESGALLLQNTCPEVVPYDQEWVKHILTNSMKAEHYIKSGLNGIPTSVMSLADCIAIAAGEMALKSKDDSQQDRERSIKGTSPSRPASHSTVLATGSFAANGHGLPSQNDFVIRGEAFVSKAPITFLGFVNRETGVIEEEGHPLDGESMANKIVIFPKGSGSSVAPYVILELIYRGQGPLAMINTHIDQHSAPACSLEGVPYAFDFDEDVIGQINHGDQIELERAGQFITVRVLERIQNDQPLLTPSEK